MKLSKKHPRIFREIQSQNPHTQSEPITDSTKEDVEPYKDDGFQEIHRKVTSADKFEHETEHDSNEPQENDQPGEKETHENRNPVRADEEYDQLRERHPYVEDMSRWSEIEKRKDLYMHVKEVQRNGEVPDMTLREWAHELDTSYSTLRCYLEDVKQPEAFDILDRNEEARRLRESKLAPEAFEHRIDPSEVYHHFKHLKDTKEHSPKDLAAAIEKMYQSSEHDSRMQWAELRPYHTGGPRWLRDVAKSIEQNREEVERELNQRMGLDNNANERIRLGLVDSKLYMRRQDTSEYNWMNMYRNELVYFKSLEEKKGFVEETRNRLGIQGTRRLSQLIDQITDKERTVQSSNANYDTKDTVNHLRGYSLGMMLDTNNQRIQDIQSKIEGIGKARKGEYGIKKPQLPSEKETIDSMFSSVFGAGLSDGHIEKLRHGFVYSESNKKRVEIFNKQVDRFGEVYRCEETLPSGVLRTRYSTAFGRLLENRGMTSGDKTLQNEGWPSWLKRVSPEALTNYYGALWAEDGSFNVQKSGRATFQVERGVALRDPSKSENYGRKNIASKDLASFVHEYGDESEDDAFGRQFKLRTGSLKDLENSYDTGIAKQAQELRGIINDNKPKLMMDEQEGLASMGIDTSEYFIYLTYSENTGRLSTLWHYETRTKDDAMRTALQCPPDDEVKRAKVEKWMNSESESERRERIQSEIESMEKKGS